MSLKLAEQAAKAGGDPVVVLYRSMVKELPKVLSIYDIDMSLSDAVSAVRGHFDKNAHVSDPRVRSRLIAKGYMELEETLMQWKQKAQLMRVFEGWELRHYKNARKGASAGPLTAVDEFSSLAAQNDGMIVDGVHYSEEFTSMRAKANAAGLSGGLPGEELWRSWSPELLGPEPEKGAPYFERFDHAFQGRYHSYMSLRDPIWIALQADIDGGMEKAKAGGVVRAMTEEQYLEIVKRHVASPAFKAFAAEHAYAVPQGELDGIVSLVEAEHTDMIAASAAEVVAKEGVTAEDAWVIAKLRFRERTDKHEGLPEHMARRKVGVLFREDLDELCSGVNERRWQEAESEKDVLGMASDYGFPYEKGLKNFTIMEHCKVSDDEKDEKVKAAAKAEFDKLDKVGQFRWAMDNSSRAKWNTPVNYEDADGAVEQLARYLS